jgi:hypothetical protein
MDLGTYIKDRISIEFLDLLAGHIPSLGGESETGNLLVEIILEIKIITLQMEINSLACDYGCLSDEQAGTGFWSNFALYELCDVCDYLIDLAITNGWVAC